MIAAIAELGFMMLVFSAGLELRLSIWSDWGGWCSSAGGWA